MADEAGGGAPVVSLGIEYGALLQGLKDIEQKINATQAAMTTAFSKPITISIDTSQFDRLTKYFASLRGTLTMEFGTLGNTITDEMGKSTTAIVQNLSGIQLGIQKLTELSSQAGQQIGQNLAAGMKAGTDVILQQAQLADDAFTKLTTRQQIDLQSSVDRLQRLRDQLTPDSQAQLQSTLNSKGLGTIDLTKKSNYLVQGPTDVKPTVNDALIGTIADISNKQLASQNAALAEAAEKAKAVGSALSAGVATGAADAEVQIKKLTAQQVDRLETIQAQLARRISALPAAHQAQLAATLGPERDPTQDSSFLRTTAKGTPFISSANTDAIKAAVTAQEGLLAEQNHQISAETTASKLLTAEETKVAAALAKSYQQLSEQAKTSLANTLSNFKVTLGGLSSEAQSRVNDSLHAGGLDLNNPASFVSKTATGTPFVNSNSLGTVGRTLNTEKVDNSGEKEKVTLLDAILNRHQSINSSLLDNAAKLAGGILLYRVIRDTIREIESLVTSFVQAGVQYTTQLEGQKQQLAGILASNFDVTNAQGQQLTGASKVRAVITEAANQQKALTEATKGTSATVKDLSEIYAEVAAPIAHVKGSTDDIQSITHLAAQAAETMGISYKEIGAEISSIMSGAGANSKLAHALQIDPGDIKSLAQTPALLAKVKQGLADLATGHDQGLAGIIAQFKQLVGDLSAHVEAPILEVFKSFVQYADALQNTAGFQSFLNQLKTAFSEVAVDMVAFGHNMAAVTVNTGPMVLGLRDVIGGVIALFEGLVKATKAVLELIGTNQLLLRWLAWGVGLLLIVRYLGQLGESVIETVKDLYEMGAGLVEATRELYLHVASLVADKAATVALSSSTIALTSAFATAGASIIAGALIYGLTLLAKHYMDVKEAADAALASSNKMAHGDFDGAILQRSKELGSDDLTTRGNAALVVGSTVDAYNKMLASHGLDVNKTSQAITILKQKQDELNASLSDGSKRSPEEQARMEGLADSYRKTTTELQHFVDQGKFAAQNVGTVKTAITDLQEKIAADQEKLRTGKGLGPHGGMAGQVTTEIAESQKLLAQLQGDLPKIEKQVGDVDRAEHTITKPGDVLTPAKTDLPADKVKPDLVKPESFAERTGVGNEILNEELAVYKSIHDDKLRYDGKLIVDSQTMADKAVEIETRRRVFLTYEYNEELKDLKKNHDEQLAENQRALDRAGVGKGDDRSPALNAQYDKDRQTLDDTYQKSVLASSAAATAARLKQVKEEQADNDKRVQLTAQAEENIAKLYGDTDQKIEIAERARIARLHDEMIAAGTPKEQADASTNKQLAALPVFLDNLRNKEWAQSAAQQITSIREQEALLEKQLANGQISIKGYLEQAAELRTEHAAAIQEEITANQGSLDNLLAHPLPDAIKQQELITAYLDKIRSLNDALTDLASKAKQFQTVMGDLSKFLSDLNSASQGKALDNQFGHIFDGLTKILSLGPQIQSITAHVLDFFKVFTANADGSDNGGGITGVARGFTNIFRNVFGGNGNGSLNPGTGSASAAGNLVSSFERVDSLGNVVDDSSGLLASTSSIGYQAAVPGGTAATAAGGAAAGVATAGIAIGIAAAITIGVAMFNNSVEAAKKKLSASLQAVADDLRAGIITTGESEQALEAARQKAIEQNSGSKSGRDALDSLLPQFDEQIKQAQAANLATQKAFQDNLRGLTAGVGAYGDFARTLFDLQDKAKTYLDSFPHSGIDANGQQFTATTQQDAKYAEALAQVTQLFTLTMDGLRNQLITQQQGFEQTAIASAQHVIDLGDQLTQLYQQLAANQLAKNRLTEDMADEPRKEALQWAKIQDDRVKHVQQVLDLEKQIADVITQAAQSEADIRRQGVVEAQETIAQTKARQISVVRNNAADQITGLNTQLQDLNNPLNYDYDQQVKDFIQQTTRTKEDQAIELQNLTDQTAQIQQQIRLDNIGLGYAEQVAEIETAVYGIDRDRYALADRSGQISVESAKTATIQWGQVKSLIDSIVETADGVVFNTPPGFPQIKVDIGTIHIDNSGTTINSTGPGNGSPADPGTYSPGPTPGTSNWTAPAGYHVGSRQDDGSFWGPDNGFTIAQWLVPNISGDRAPTGFHTGTERDPGHQWDSDINAWIVPDHQGDIWQRQALP